MHSNPSSELLESSPCGDNFIIAPVSGWAAWGIDPSSGEPDVSFIDALLRRRLSSLDRSALHVANQCIAEGESVRMVFASRHGELDRSAKLLSEIVAGELPSPMGFSLSVLNAVPGIHGIARQDLASATAISAGEATLPLALVEASAQAWLNPDATVLLVCADEPPPAAYADLVQSPRKPTAMAIRLEAGRMTAAIRCTWISAPGNAVLEDAVQAIHNCLSWSPAEQWAGPDHLWQWQRL